MKNLLIPTDFTQKSAAALRTAIELSKKTKVRIILLHTVPQPVIAGDWVNELVNGKGDQSVSDQSANGQTSGQESTSKGKETSFSFENEEMNDWLKAELIQNDAVHLYEEIMQVAMVSDTPTGIAHTVDFSQTDLVIIGTGKDARPIHVTSAITGQLNCGILSVPEGWEWRPFKRIMITSDFHEDDSDLLNPVLNLARMYGSIIDLVHLRGENSFVRQDVEHFNALADKLMDFEGFTYKLVVGEDYIKMIEKAAAENKSDMLVMKCRNCQIPGGLIDQLVEKLDLPIYILPKN